MHKIPSSFYALISLPSCTIKSLTKNKTSTWRWFLRSYVFKNESESDLESNEFETLRVFERFISASMLYAKIHGIPYK